MDTIWQDLRFAMRALFKSPTFALVAIISLALGIGANTAIFSVVNAILLNRLPYPEPERLVMIWGENLKNDKHRGQVSFTDIEDLRRQNQTLVDIATFQSWRPILSGIDNPERIAAVQVSEGYFNVLQAKPLLGRSFLPEDQIEGKDFVVVISHNLWQRRFNADVNVVGKKILLNSRPYSIIGVMSPELQSLPTTILDGERSELYRPLAEKHDELERSSRHLRAIARLKPGLTLTQTTTELRAIAGRLADQHPKDNANCNVNPVLLQEDLVSKIRPALIMLLLAVAAVLLIASANVANLLLARATTRQKEIAIRLALGATRLRLIRQLLTESLLLSLIGGVIGIILAAWSTSILETLIKQVVPDLAQVNFDGRVLLFTITISIITGLIFGLFPALAATKTDLNDSLKDSNRANNGLSRNGLRGALVVSEIALALVLLISAGLLIRSLAQLQKVDPGFDPKNLTTMNIWLPAAKYSEKPQIVAFYKQLIDRIEAVPGVQSAGVTSVLPASSNFDQLMIDIEGQQRNPTDAIGADRYMVTNNYLKAMAIPLLKGRNFNERDIAGATDVVIVNETMARYIWPNEDPIGKRLRSYSDNPNFERPWRTVIGVVGDVKQYGLDSKKTLQIYLPQAQSPSTYMTLVVRSEMASSELITSIRQEVNRLDREQALFDIATMDEVMASSISLRRISMLLLIVFAGIALLMSIIGIYGVLSYIVGQRTREIGIRMAIGAQPSDISRLLLAYGFKLIAIGLVIGLSVAFVVTQVMSSLLFGISSRDPFTFLVLSIFLAIIAMSACYWPARRAANLDPYIALKYQ